MDNEQVKILPFDVEAETVNDQLDMFIKSQECYIPIGVSMINAPILWNQGITGEGITIAVIDSGYTEHQDLKNNIIGGRNFTSEDNGNPNIYNDYNGHSTHVCGTICANGHIKGVAPNAKLLILKVLDKSGNGNAQSVLNAIEYAISQKVDIISMSLGMPSNILQISNSIKKAVTNDISVVCASGNNGDGKAETSEVDYPAGYNSVISVGAIDNTRLGAVFSNSNKQVDLVAPGVNVISTSMNGGYCIMSGTSMSVPHVTGALALIKEWGNKEFGRVLTEAEVYAQLVKRTLDLNIPRTIQGNGMLYL